MAEGAKHIIQKFGGQTALGQLLGRRQSTVSHWAKRGVPTKWQQPILDLARKHGIDLSPEDFFQESSSFPVLSPNHVIPKATHWGELPIGETTLPCYVLETGERVFSLKGVVVGLIGTQGGQLAEYLKVRALKEYLPDDLTPDENGDIPALMTFDTGAFGVGAMALGLQVEKLIDLCSAYSSAADQGKLTDRQQAIATTANAFLRACSKVGIIALVDEATGYQYDREERALQFKLKIFLSEELRKWEKTFPDELWKEFARLTHWDRPLHVRPKYWGKLVMELVYGYLDQDVCDWLRKHAPKPMKGQNYHQWLSGQYGLKRLNEHIWMLIGIAKTCATIGELQQIMAERFGAEKIQMSLYLRLPEKKITFEEVEEN
jgi:P63C domain